MKDYAMGGQVTLIAYSILLRGAYTRSDRELPIQFAGPEANERLEVLKQVTEEVGCSPSQTIIAWMRQSTPSVLPIVAASREEHLKENIEALKVTLTGDQMQRLDTAGNPVVEQGWIQST